MVDRLSDKKISIELTESAYQAIEDEGFDPIYGARPLKRFIQSQIETKLAKEMIKGHISTGDHIIVDYEQDFILRS